MKGFFAKVVEPKWMRHFHATLTIAWVGAGFAAYEIGLLKSVMFVSLISIYALVIGHFSSWQAARAEEAAIEGDSTDMIEEIHETISVDPEDKLKVDVGNPHTHKAP